MNRSIMKVWSRSRSGELKRNDKDKDDFSY